MKGKKRKKKGVIKLIVSLLLAVAVTISLIVTNFFVPVRYLGAYINFKKDRIAPSTMRVRFIDVGYGDSTLVEFPDGKTMLIDAGTGTYANIHKLLKILNSSGIDKLDYLVCTSVKSEHCGGLDEIVKYKPVGTAFIPYVENRNITDEYAAFYSSLSANGVVTEIVEYGKGVYNTEYGYRFFFLSPTTHALPDSEYNQMNVSPTSENIDAASVVMWLEYSGNGFLFLSDSSASVQDKVARTMIAENNKYVFDGLQFTLSKCVFATVANHCGANFLHADLFGVFQPESAIVSVGKNAAGCPSLTEIAAIQQYVGERLYRTDLSGTVTVTVANGQYSVGKEI